MTKQANLCLEYQQIEDILPKKNKQLFLQKLSSHTGSKNPYKRFLGSPLRYAGGKSLAVGLILQQIPEDTKLVISPLLGGASVEIACSTGAGMHVIGYDIFDILVNYWQIQIENPEELANGLSKFEATNEEFKKVKERLKLHWEKKKRIENKTELAAYYYYNHNTSYGPGFLSWPS